MATENEIISKDIGNYILLNKPLDLKFKIDPTPQDVLEINHYDVGFLSEKYVVEKDVDYIDVYEMVVLFEGMPVSCISYKPIINPSYTILECKSAYLLSISIHPVDKFLQYMEEGRKIVPLHIYNKILNSSKKTFEKFIEDEETYGIAYVFDNIEQYQISNHFIEILYYYVKLLIKLRYSVNYSTERYLAKLFNTHGVFDSTCSSIDRLLSSYEQLNYKNPWFIKAVKLYVEDQLSQYRSNKYNITIDITHV